MTGISQNPPPRIRFQSTIAGTARIKTDKIKKTRSFIDTKAERFSYFFMPFTDNQTERIFLQISGKRDPDLPVQ